jgi:hypothetical protein
VKLTAGFAVGGVGLDCAHAAMLASRITNAVIVERSEESL